MNQILSTKIKKFNKPQQFKVQFYISIFSILVVVFIFLFYKFKSKEFIKKSDSFSNNYEIYRLYSNPNTKSNYLDSDILGFISIPKLNISYPFFYGYNEELLKISPCRFYGEMPPKYSNLCITAHNYNDDRFFGKINLLKNDDIITIEDNYNNKYYYYVYNIFEVEENDISPLINYDKNYLNLTLITCNNINKKRIIVHAIQ